MTIVSISRLMLLLESEFSLACFFFVIRYFILDDVFLGRIELLR